MYDVRPQTTLNDAERVVLLVVHEKDRDIRADRKTETLGRVSKIVKYDYPLPFTHQEECIDDGVY